MLRTVVLLAAPLALGACATSLAPPAGDDIVGVADLRTSSGQSAGTATVVAIGNSLVVDVAARNLPAGSKGFHLHTTGQCDAPDFQSAGGHLNPFNKDHGFSDPGGAHLGDLPNLDVEPSGVTRARFNLTGSREQILPYLFDADGTAVMIHAQPDDYVTDPSGDAGSRIACGVLRRS